MGFKQVPDGREQQLGGGAESHRVVEGQKERPRYFGPKTHWSATARQRHKRRKAAMLARSEKDTIIVRSTVQNARH